MEDKFGFISVRQHSEFGYFGGFLILNRLGRPLEFHCTLPVKPTRAQCLLYGATIDDFVCGEQIAMALVAKAKLKPQILFTDCLPVLALSLVCDNTLLMLDCEENRNSAGADLCRPPSAMPNKTLQIGDHQFVVPESASIDLMQIEAALQEIAPSLDLSEPFERVLDALLEAHPNIRAA